MCWQFVTTEVCCCCCCCYKGSVYIRCLHLHFRHCNAVSKSLSYFTNQLTSHNKFFSHWKVLNACVNVAVDAFFNQIHSLNAFLFIFHLANNYPAKQMTELKSRTCLTWMVNKNLCQNFGDLWAEYEICWQKFKLLFS